MKISEIEAILRAERKKRGDVEVIFHGHYGETETTFEVMADADVHVEDRQNLHIWTDICTG